MKKSVSTGRPGASGRGHDPVAVAAFILCAALSGAALAQAGTDPFQPTVQAVNTVTNFAIWAVRMLGFGGLVVSAVKAYFKKFDFVFLASVLAGIALIASAPLLINWLFTLGGLTDASSIGTYTAR